MSVIFKVFKLQIQRICTMQIIRAVIIIIISKGGKNIINYVNALKLNKIFFKITEIIIEELYNEMCFITRHICLNRIYVYV